MISSGAEPGFLNTSPSFNQIRNLEKYEKPEKETEAPLIHEPSVNGSSTPGKHTAHPVCEDVQLESRAVSLVRDKERPQTRSS